MEVGRSHRAIPLKTDKAAANGKNHKQSVIRTNHQNEPQKAGRAHVKLSILDTVHKPFHCLERVILK